MHVAARWNASNHREGREGKLQSRLRKAGLNVKQRLVDRRAAAMRRERLESIRLEIWRALAVSTRRGEHISIQTAERYWADAQIRCVNMSRENSRGSRTNNNGASSMRSNAARGALDLDRPEEDGVAARRAPDDALERVDRLVLHDTGNELHRPARTAGIPALRHAQRGAASRKERDATSVWAQHQDRRREGALTLHGLFSLRRGVRVR
eukprot:3669596-Pleurochrysis_carterae.AAC.2